VREDNGPLEETSVSSGITGSNDRVYGRPTTVGVLIVNWNSGPLLIRCLDALRRQSFGPTRVLVVDNASRDGSEQAALERDGVELLTMTANLGFAAANNIGVAHLGNCEWIALLNPDAFPEPGWLAALVGGVGAAPLVASVASRQVLADDPDTLDGTGDLYTVAGLAWRRHHGQPARNRGLERGEVFGPCGAAGLYRRDVFLETGGFDESYFCYFEDVDLAFRLRLKGYRCLYIPEAVVHHVGSALTGFRSDFAVFHGQRNMVWTFVKDMPGPLLLQYLPHHLLMNLASIGVLAARGQLRTALRAKWAALLGVPRMLRARRGIHRERRVTSAQLRSAMIRGLRSLGIGRKEP